MTSDDMDLLDDDEAPLIKDGSPPPTSMVINMVFTPPAEFRGAEEEVDQMCLSPKEAMFEKPKESSQHLKSLYIQGHIDGKPISRMGRRRCCCQSNVVLHLQEAWKEGQRIHEDEPDA
jgi:hypothetical protein